MGLCNGLGLHFSLHLCKYLLHDMVVQNNNKKKITVTVESLLSCNVLCNSFCIHAGTAGPFLLQWKSMCLEVYSSEYLSDVLASVDIKLRAELQGREMSQGDASHHFQVFFAP